MKRDSKYYFIVLVIIIMLCLTLLLDSSIASRITTIITLSTACIGAVALFIQYKSDKNVHQASFILEYAKYFYSLNKVEDTMMKLDEYRNGNKDIVNEISYNGMVNYLFWCEELSSLVQKGIIDLDTIDNLFSYTFFLVTNNKYVQEKELVPQREYYKGVFYLHKAWTDYKVRTHQPVMNEEESLSKVECYEESVQKGNFSNKRTF